jgi:CRISPR-associated endonuclease Cas2
MSSHYMIIYDISIPKIREKLLILLEEFGFFRTQCSVFVATLSPKQHQQLKSKLDAFIKHSPQSIDLIFIPIEVSNQSYFHHIPKEHIETKPLDHLFILDNQDLCL